MTGRNISRLIVSSLALIGAIGPVSGSSSAQQSRPILAAPQVPRDAIRIACCRCIDGSRQTVQINTRQATWSVAGPGSTTFQPVAAQNNPAWTPVAPAGWVAPAGRPEATGDYTYRLLIYVPPCVLRPEVVISGRFAADNSARVFIGNTLVKSSNGTPDYGFLPGGVTPFSTTLTTPGLHELRVVVTNRGGVTGMIMQAAITVTCPRDLEIGGIRDMEATSNTIPRELRATEPRP